MEPCRRACVGVQVEVGSGYGLHEQVEVGSGYGLHEQVEVRSGYGLHEHSKQPADVLAAKLDMGKPAAFDFTVTSPLVSNSLPEASVTAVTLASGKLLETSGDVTVKSNADGLPKILQTYII